MKKLIRYLVPVFFTLFFSSYSWSLVPDFENSYQYDDSIKMNVDAYQSKTKPQFGIIVPSGTSLDSFSGDVEETIKNLEPFQKKKSNVALDRIAVSGSDLFVHLNNQLSAQGTGIMKTEVTFTYSGQVQTYYDIGGA